MVFLKNALRLVFLVLGFSPTLNLKSQFIGLLKQDIVGVRTIIPRFVAGLSILALINTIYVDGFSETLQHLIGVYEAAVGQFFAYIRLTQLVTIVSELLRSMFDVDLDLQPHWKHVFVLLGFYFFREILLNLSESRFKTAIYNLVVGLPCATIFSAAAGSIRPTPAHTMDDFLIGSLPIFAALIYHILGLLWDATADLKFYENRNQNEAPPTPYQIFSTGLCRSTSRNLAGITIVLIGIHVPPFNGLPIPGLGVLVLIVLLFGIYWLIDGAFDAKRFRADDEPAFEAYLRSSHTRLGANIFGSFTLAAITVIGAAMVGRMPYS